METFRRNVPFQHVNRPVMSRLAEAFGQLVAGPFWQRSVTVPGVCADDDGTFVVWPGDPVGSRVLDRPASELAWAHVLRFPRIPVGDGEPTRRCNPRQHEDRRISPCGVPSQTQANR